MLTLAFEKHQHVIGWTVILNATKLQGTPLSSKIDIPPHAVLVSGRETRGRMLTD